VSQWQKWLFWIATLPLVGASIIASMIALIPMLMLAAIGSDLRIPYGDAMIRNLEKYRDWYEKRIP